MIGVTEAKKNEELEELKRIIPNGNFLTLMPPNDKVEILDAEKKVLRTAHEKISEVLEWAESPDKETCIQGIYAIVGIMQMTDAVLDNIRQSEWGNIHEYRTADKRQRKN